MGSSLVQQNLQNSLIYSTQCGKIFMGFQSPTIFRVVIDALTLFFRQGFYHPTLMLINAIIVIDHCLSTHKYSSGPLGGFKTFGCILRFSAFLRALQMISIIYL